MSSLPRLRHIVLVVDDIDGASRELTSVLDIEEVFREPPGLGLEMENAVLALQNGFLEVCAGTGPTAPPRRYLERNGEGGYMVLLQFPDFAAAEARARAAGARVVFEYDTEEHRERHLHPADTGAAIVGIEWSRRWDDWRWAGTDWQRRLQRVGAPALLRIRIGADDPDSVAARWESMFGIAFGTDGDSRAAEQLDPGITIAPWDRPGSRVTGIELRAADASAILSRARERGLPVSESSIRMLGIDFAFAEA